MPAAVPAAICRRMIIAQSLYALGALLSVVHTYVSIAWIVLVQLYYVIAPRLPGRALNPLVGIGSMASAR